MQMFKVTVCNVIDKKTIGCIKTYYAQVNSKVKLKRKRTGKFLVHVPDSYEEPQVGQTVYIRQCARFSKRKSFILTNASAS